MPIILLLVVFMIGTFFGFMFIKNTIAHWLVGGISFLGGGIPETFVWSANFWYLLSLFFTKNKKYKEAIIFSIIATLISISFMLWKEVLWSESGSTASILSLEIGYFLWVISMIILLVNSILLFYKKDS